MFSSLGVLYVDHYAVTTKDLIGTLNDYLSIPGAKLLRGPGQNTAQNVNYAFVELNGMGTIEILSPLNDDSPIINHIKSGSGAYHLCYAVPDLNNAIKIAQENFSAKLVVEPREDNAFDGRKVAFLMHPHHGLFELLEAFPKCLDQIEVGKPNINDVDHDDKSRLLGIYNHVMQTVKTDIDIVSMKNCPKWDSMNHLLLMMEIEKQYEINIPATDFSTLNDLKTIHTYLSKK